MNNVEILDNGSFLVEFDGFNSLRNYRLVLARPDSDGHADPSTWISYPVTCNMFSVPAILGAGTYRLTIFEINNKEKYGLPVWWQDITVNEEQAGNKYVPKYTSECTEYVHWCNEAFINAVNEITAGLTEDYDILTACANRVHQIVYDYIKMVKTAKQKTIPIPDLNECLTLKKGICWDCAPLLCGMLRSLGYNAKLVVGTLNDDVFSTGHCWVEVYYENSWKKIEAVKNNVGKKASAYHAEYYY